MQLVTALIAFIFFILILASWVNTKFMRAELNALKKQLGIVQSKSSIFEKIVSKNKSKDLSKEYKVKNSSEEYEGKYLSDTNELIF